jgi:hypothetical protein
MEAGCPSAQVGGIIGQEQVRALRRVRLSSASAPSTHPPPLSSVPSPPPMGAGRESSIELGCSSGPIAPGGSAALLRGDWRRLMRWDFVNTCAT